MSETSLEAVRAGALASWPGAPTPTPRPAPSPQSNVGMLRASDVLPRVSLILDDGEVVALPQDEDTILQSRYLARHLLATVSAKAVSAPAALQ